MATIVLNVPDESLLSQLKRACLMLKGVASVKIQKDSAKMHTKSLDVTQAANFKEAMDDVKHGRVKSVQSTDDMFNQILGENWRNV